MTGFENIIIDIGNEVIRFAHDQGHTKASKEALSWNGLETKCGKVEFAETSRRSKTTSIPSNDAGYAAFLEQVAVKDLTELTDDSPVTAVARDQALEFVNGVKSEEKMLIRDNYLLNTNENKRLCRVAFKPSCKNTAEANVKLTSTLVYNTKDLHMGHGSRSHAQQEQVKQSKRKMTSPRSKTAPDAFAATAGLKSFDKISLLPRFPSKFQICSTKSKKIQLAAKDRHELMAKIPPGIKVPIEIMQKVSEESGTFSATYFLWGTVTVIVWGKPYKLRITDILDPKYNEHFTRENVLSSTIKKRSITIEEDQEIQIVKFTVRGQYECKSINNEIQLRIPNCILRRPSYSLLSLTCTCDTTELPMDLKEEQVLPLTNKNLAKIMFRWKHILYSFRSKQDAKENEWLWKALLCTNTQLASTAVNINIDEVCHKLTPIDKFVFTMLLWKENCNNLQELGNKQRDCTTLSDLQSITINLIKQLYEIGIPVPVMSFLWSVDEANKTSKKSLAYTCPLHRFESKSAPQLQGLSNSIQSRMQAPLPDRVLTRLSQRWLPSDGWIATAIHLGIDLNNIKNWASSNNAFKTVTEKYLTVLKLWRMKQRRNSVEAESPGTTVSGQCVTWDLCIQLQEIGLPISAYNFLWLETETTP